MDAGEKVIVGVNRFVDADAATTEVFPIDPELQRQQVDRVRRTRAERDQAGVDAALADLEAASQGTENLLVAMKEALRQRATLGEVSDVLGRTFGTYQPTR